MTQPGTPQWYASVTEDIIDPERPIIDPHHHLWQVQTPFGRYELDDLWADTGSGHNVEKTVFIDCHSNYRSDGPRELRPIGETEYVAGVAAESAKNPQQATIAGIVGHADMRLGKDVANVLQAHEAAGQGLFRGIRHAGPHEETGTLMLGSSTPCPYDDPQFREGVATLGEMGYSYDTWHYHLQNKAFAALARAVPQTPMILDHFGTPLGAGAYAGKQEDIYAQWLDDIAEIAECPNVVAKLGGMAMPDNGFGWHERAQPPSSDEFVEHQQRYYHHTIKCFGANRCLFESNFPVDRLSISYHVLYNGLKKIAADYTQEEQHAMFYGTAERIYRL